MALWLTRQILRAYIRQNLNHGVGAMSMRLLRQMNVAYVCVALVALACAAAFASPAQPATPGHASGLMIAQAPASSATQPKSKQTPAVSRDALLLVIDAFNVVRMLEDDEFMAKRDEIARNLLRNLIPFLCPQQKTPGGNAAVAPGGTAGKAKVPPAPKPAATPKPKPKPKPPVRQAKPKPASQAKPPAKGSASAYAKVPQKKRIKRKFEAAREPFEKLQKEDPQKAAVVAELLKAARAAFARQQFDTAESYLDHALDMMGVPKPK